MFNICSPPRGLGLQNTLKLTEIRGGRRICSGLLFDSSAPAERLSGVEWSEVGSSSSCWCFPFPASAFVIHLQVQLPPNDELISVCGESGLSFSALFGPKRSSFSTRALRLCWPALWRGGKQHLLRHQNETSASGLSAFRQDLPSLRLRY